MRAAIRVRTYVLFRTLNQILDGGSPSSEKEQGSCADLFFNGAYARILAAVYL
ncbi:MAG: hypothetical protein ACM3QS_03850 [Bacteroidota bacterium]